VTRKSLNSMSAYGTITLANGPVDLLPPTTWDLSQPVPSKSAGPFRRLVLHHLRLDSARALPSGSGPSLLNYTHRIFAAEVEAGRTYPQETDASASAAGGESDADEELGSAAAGHGVGVGVGDTHAYTRAAFEAYFWAADVIVAIGIGQSDDAPADGGGDDQVQARAAGSGEELTLEVSRAGRRWEEALVGFYYVKPNYPGRSSHVSTSVSYVPLFLFYTPRKNQKNKHRFAMQVSLSLLLTGDSDMERHWASRTCIMDQRSDTKQVSSIWCMQIIQGV
jgi:hypothetical protein